MATQEEVDAFLAHHGVLGMHWGVRKAAEPTTKADLKEKINEINAKLEKGDGNNVLTGYGIKGATATKRYNKAIKKNPGFSYGKLSPEEKRKYDKKTYNMAERSLLGKTAVESALILVGGNVVSNHVQTKNQELTRKVTLLLLASNGFIRVSQLKSLHNAEKTENLHSQRQALQKQLDQMKKTKK